MLWRIDLPLVTRYHVIQIRRPEFTKFELGMQRNAKTLRTGLRLRSEAYACMNRSQWSEKCSVWPWLIFEKKCIMFKIMGKGSGGPKDRKPITKSTFFILKTRDAVGWGKTAIKSRDFFFKVELMLILHGFLNMPLSCARHECNGERCPYKKCDKYAFYVNGLVSVLMQTTSSPQRCSLFPQYFEWPT